MHFWVAHVSSHGVPPQAVGAAKEIIKFEINQKLLSRFDVSQAVEIQVLWSKISSTFFESTYC